MLGGPSKRYASGTAATASSSMRTPLASMLPEENLIDKVLSKVGIKPKPDPSVSYNHKKHALVMQFNEQLKNIEAKRSEVLRMVQTRLSANKNDACIKEKAQLKELALKKQKIETALAALERQESTLESKRVDVQLADVIKDGNEELKKESQRFSQLASDDIGDDYDETIQEALADEMGFVGSLARTENDALNRAESAEIETVVGRLSLADVVDQEFEDIRRGIQEQEDKRTLDIRDELPPVPSGPLRSDAVFAPRATTQAPFKAKSSLAVGTTPSLSLEEDWLA